MINNHTIEPEQLGFPPRKVQAQPGKPATTPGCLRFFLLPFILVGLWLLVSGVWSVVVANFGSTAPATVTGRYTKTQSEGGDIHRLTYVYQLNAQDRSGEVDVTWAEYAYPAGTKAVVRFMPFLPGRGEQLLLPGAEPRSWAPVPWGYVIAWNAFIYFIAYVTFMAPVANKKLVRDGTACIGRIIDKRERTSDDTTSYYLDYEFLPQDMPDNRATRSWLKWSKNKLLWPNIAPRQGMFGGQMLVNRVEWDTLNIGDVVTVIYYPGKPLQSTIYRFCGYEVSQ